MIIGISGKKTVGKDYIGNLISAETGMSISKFAAPVYEYAYLVMEGTREELRVRISKDGYITNVELDAAELSEFIFDQYHSIADLTTLENGKPRKLLQFIGTDVFRQQIDTNYWVKLAAKRDNVIFTDVRFPNEAAICDVNLRLIGGDETDNHESEKLNFHYDYFIDNTEKSPGRAKLFVESFLGWVQRKGYTWN